MLNKQGYPSGIMTSPPSLFLKMTLLTGYLDNLKKKKSLKRIQSYKDASYLDPSYPIWGKQ